MLLQNTHALGVFVEEGIRKFALVCRLKGSIEVLGMGEERLASVDLREEGAFLGKKRLPLIATLPSKDLLFRRFPLNVKSHHHLMKALPFQLETRLPYPTSEAVVAIEYEKQELLLYATREKCVEEALTALKKRALDPDHLAPLPAALAAFCSRFFPDKPDLTFLFLAKDEACMGSLKEGRCMTTFPFTHIERHLAALPSSAPVLLLGSLGASLREAVEQSGRKVLTIDQRMSSYAVPIGLACLALMQPVDLRVGRFLSRLGLRRRAIPRFSAILAAVLLLLTTTIATHTSLHHREARIAQELSQVLQRDISADEIRSAVDTWEGALADVKSPAPPLPKISDLLAFLSTHPLLCQNGVDLRRLRFTGAKVELEFVAPATRSSAIREILASEKRFVDREKGVQLEQLPESYLYTFSPPRGRS